MKAKRAKIFVSHYPPDLVEYKTIATLAKTNNPLETLLLLKVDHPYSFDSSPYLDSFDKVIEFPFIEYHRKNIFRGIANILLFKHRLKQALAMLLEFEHIDVYIENSAWLPANALLFALAKSPQVKHIYRLTLEGKIPGIRIDWLRTSFCRFYHLFITVYPTYAMKRDNGGFVTFLYAHKQKIPGIPIKIINPTLKNKGSLTQNEIAIPYPIIKTSQTEKATPNMVIVFGDTGMLKDFPDYMATSDSDAEKILRDFFTAFETYYQGTPLYYKPHPGAPKDLLPGMTPKHYKWLPAQLNADAILQEYWPRMKAAYTFFSTSIMRSSFFGIPSYTLYRLVYNERGIKRLDYKFKQPHLASKLIFPLSTNKDIGKIDSKKTSINTIDLSNIPSIYKLILR